MNVDDQQAATRDLIRLMMDKTGLDSTGLARLAGFAPSTLTRFLNQPVKHMLSARTLAKLSAATGVPVPSGSPITAPTERELLDAFRSTDEQGREMLLRLAKSLRREVDLEKPEPPTKPQPTRGRSAACVVSVSQARGRR